jgi:hypothetical protein
MKINNPWNNKSLNNLMRMQVQNERTIIQIQATVTKQLVFVHTHNSARTKFQRVLVRLVCWAIRVGQDKGISEQHLRP